MKPLLIFGAAFALICCSPTKTDFTKTRTLAAWKAMQKAAHDNVFEGPTLALEDPSTLVPQIKYYRDIAFSYSQIDLDGVDEMLIDYIKRSIEAFEETLKHFKRHITMLLRLPNRGRKIKTQLHGLVNS